MKIRSGFVSNSSSSSFVFVGFPTSAINDTILDYKKSVTEGIPRRTLDRYAQDNIGSDENYEKYLAGNAPESFWEKAYEHFKGDLGYNEAPEGYESHEVYGKKYKAEPWIGIDVAYVSDSGTDELDLDEIDKAKKKIKKDFPKVTPKIILGSNSN